MTFRTFLEPFERTKLLKSEVICWNIKLPSHLLHTDDVQNTFKRSYFGLKFFGDLVKD